MIDGEVPTEDGVLRTALMIEYEQKMLAEGNVKEYTRVLRRRLGRVSVQAVIGERLSEHRRIKRQ